MLASLLSYGLLTSCTRTESIVEPTVKAITKHWAVELNEICSDLSLARIPQVLWQEHVEKLFGRIELSELLGFIDFDTLARGMKFPDLGVTTKNVGFPELDGLPKDVKFIKKVFGMKKDRAIIPHGHSNMASAHLVLKGKFALRHFEKVEEQRNHLLIRPTIDKTAEAGSSSSISDEKNNIHWFVATTETAFTFDVIMLDLNGKKHDIHNLDIRDGEKISDGLIRARKIDVETGLKKYGKEAFH